MFGSRRVKQLKELYMQELKKSCRWQWKYEHLEAERSKHQFCCEKCKRTFNVPSYKSQVINQHGGNQVYVICLVCGSRHIKMKK